MPPPCPARGISVASAIRYVVEELSGDERPRAMVYTPTGSLFINKIEALYDNQSSPKPLSREGCQPHSRDKTTGTAQLPAGEIRHLPQPPADQKRVWSLLSWNIRPYSVASPATSARLELTLNVPGPLTAARATAASSELSDESGGRIAGSRLRERANHIRTRTEMRDGSL